MSLPQAIGLIQRGDCVRLRDRGRTFYGTVMTAQSQRLGGDHRVRVCWHPEWSTWEKPEDLTAFNMLDLVKP